MDTQSMYPRRQFRYVYAVTGPRAGTWQIIPPSSSVQSYDYPNSFTTYHYLAAANAAAGVLDDDDDDDDDDYLPLDVLPLPAHSSSKRSRVAGTSEAILSLEEVTGRSRSGEECAVCLQDFRADETLRAMPCSHAFHQHCISEWLRRNAICPLCRCRLPEEEDKQRRRI